MNIPEMPLLRNKVGHIVLTYRNLPLGDEPLAGLRKLQSCVFSYDSFDTMVLSGSLGERVFTFGITADHQTPYMRIESQKDPTSLEEQTKVDPAERFQSVVLDFRKITGGFFLVDPYQGAVLSGKNQLSDTPGMAWYSKIFLTATPNVQENIAMRNSVGFRRRRAWKSHSRKINPSERRRAKLGIPIAMAPTQEWFVHSFERFAEENQLTDLQVLHLRYTGLIQEEVTKAQAAPEARADYEFPLPRECGKISDLSVGSKETPLI